MWREGLRRQSSIHSAHRRRATTSVCRRRANRRPPFPDRRAALASRRGRAIPQSQTTPPRRAGARQGAAVSSSSRPRAERSADDSIARRPEKLWKTPRPRFRDRRSAEAGGGPARRVKSSGSQPAAGLRSASHEAQVRRPADPGTAPARSRRHARRPAPLENRHEITGHTADPRREGDEAPARRARAPPQSGALAATVREKNTEPDRQQKNGHQRDRVRHDHPVLTRASAVGEPHPQP